MAEPPLDAAIARLYQLPLEQFVEARQALARSSSREDARVVRELPKPNVAAWGLNQLYWSSRPTFDRLVEAASRLRTAQANALAGKPGDVRSAGDVHRQSLADAVRETSRIIEAAGHPVSSDVLRTLTAALEAVPWKEPPGRLAKPPGPSGFGVFAGLPVVERVAPPAPRQASVPPQPPRRSDSSAPATEGRPAGEGVRSRGTQAKAIGPVREAIPDTSSKKPAGVLEEERRRQGEERARAALTAAQAEAAAARARLETARERTARVEEEERAARARLDEAQDAVKAARADLRAAERDDFAARAAVKKAERAARQ